MHNNGWALKYFKGNPKLGSAGNYTKMSGPHPADVFTLVDKVSEASGRTGAPQTGAANTKNKPIMTGYSGYESFISGA